VISAAQLLSEAGESKKVFDYGEPLRIRLETSERVGLDFGLEVRIKNSQLQPVAYASSWIGAHHRFRAGEVIQVTLPSLTLAEGLYYLDFICRIPGVKHLDQWPDEVAFNVVNASPGSSLVSIKASDELGVVVLEDVLFAAG